jgi:hypothetical protein
LGFGNLLYPCLYVAAAQWRGEDCRMLDIPAMADWLIRYPALRRLTVDGTEVSWTDRRRWVWHSRFGEDFSRAELDRFIGDYLPLTGRADAFGEVVVNVRRGDYYDVPHFRGTYSFDVAGYVEIALSRCAETAPIERITVISDGLEWCRLKLDGLARRFTPEVSYVPGSPQESFDRIATAPRLIGTNSSFSYWGGYVSGCLYGERAHVVMPRFHARLGNDWSAYQLDPTWDIVDAIPGGWNA